MKHSTLLVSLALALGSSIVYAQAGSQGAAATQSQASVSAQPNGASANGSSSAGAHAENDHVAASSAGGDEFAATLSKPVDAKQSKPGDEVAATTTQDMKSNGEIVVPKGSTLVGHVTSSRPRSAGSHASSDESAADKSRGSGGGLASSDASQLGIVFDKAILKNGRQVPLSAAIRAIAAGDTGASSDIRDDPPAMSGFGQTAGMGRAAGGGLLGGAAGSGRAALGGATSAAGGIGGSMISKAGTAAAIVAHSPGAVGGLDSAGQLTSGSHGVFGIKGLDISAAGAGSTGGSLITSTARDVRLDRGTRMLLAGRTGTAGSADAAASKTRGLSGSTAAAGDASGAATGAAGTRRAAGAADATGTASGAASATGGAKRTTTEAGAASSAQGDGAAREPAH